MKLDELHIADLGACAERHRDSVSRRHFGIGRVAIELPHAPRGQQSRGAHNLLGLTFFTEQRNACHCSCVGLEPGGKFEFPHRYILERLRLGIEGAEDLASRRIALRMQNPVAAVSAFAAEDEFRSTPVKLRSPGN
jgi:hypothetical protein